MTDDYRDRAELFLRDHRLCDATDSECLAALLREVAEEQRREDVCMYTAAATEVESVRGTCDQLRADLAFTREELAEEQELSAGFCRERDEAQEEAAQLRADLAAERERVERLRAVVRATLIDQRHSIAPEEAEEGVKRWWKLPGTKAELDRLHPGDLEADRG